ncbi:MAG: glycosyltransferase [Desulfuromonas sp.]|nr:glycosyltransferase [Desulfuromonas sp.]
MDYPRFAVALATHNGLQWLDEQLDTVLSQQGVEVVVFVSDDSSVDDTVAHIRDRAMEDKRIVLLPQVSLAGGAAQNFFRLVRDIDLTDFDYLALADQDDCWCDDKLLRAHLMMHQQFADAYSSNVTAFWPDGRERLLDKAQAQRRWDFLFEAAGPGCSYVFSVQVGRQLQAFITQHRSAIANVILHDWLFYAYVRSAQFNWYIDSRSGLRYRQHSSNQLGANSGWRTGYKRLRMIRNGWYRNQALHIARLCGLGATPFVRHALGGHWWSSLYLLLHINSTRRRMRDRLVLGLSCLLHLF